MAKKGLPKQGAQAILDTWSDANETIVNQKKQKQAEEEEREMNKRLRDYVNGKES